MTLSIFTILQILIILSALYYAWFILRAFLGLRSLPAPESAPSRHSVTVLIPARNEEKNIGRCLDGLLRQDHHHDSIEFIVIDDGSTDATARIVNEYRLKDNRISLLQLGFDPTAQPSRKRGRKPEAITAGIAASKFDVIVTTDADCIAPPTWISTLTGYLNDETVYVVGPVLEDQGNEFFTRFRALEVLGLIGITGGRIGIRRPVNGHGGNTAFYKSIYNKAGGFDFSAVKSDEETLMHEVRYHRLGAIGFAATPLATVYTFSPPSFASYWNQRMRWGSMHGRFRNKSILVELLFLYFSLLFPLIGLAACYWTPELLPTVIGAFILKGIIDLMMISLSARCFGERFSFRVFLAGELVHGIIILAVSTVAQFLPYKWKDRKVLAVKT
jgi:cellulose synthase/poly-beta-1,6-N-acetylglucosamine synthase-like glycosyltransferase